MAFNLESYWLANQPCFIGSKKNHDKMLRRGKEHDWCYGTVEQNGKELPHVWIEKNTLLGKRVIDATGKRARGQYNTILRVHYDKKGGENILEGADLPLHKKIWHPNVREKIREYNKTHTLKMESAKRKLQDNKEL